MKRISIRHKILCVFVVLSIIVSVFIPVFAVNSEECTYSAITYENASGQQINTITAGEITSKITVTTKNGSINMLFVMLLYKDDILIEADAMSKAADTDGELFSATLNVADASGCKITTLLWEDARSAKPICNSSVFPSSEIGIEKITVNGEAPSKISEDVYEYEINYDELNIPEIRVITLDSGTKVEIDNVEAGDIFPGKAEVKLTSSDGTQSRCISINYVCNMANIDKLNPGNYSVDGAVYSAGHRFFQPLKITNIVVNDDKSGFTVVGEAGSHYYGNRGSFSSPINGTQYPNAFTYLNDKVSFLSELYYTTPLVADGGKNYHNMERKVAIFRKMRVYTLALEESKLIMGSVSDWTNYSTKDNTVDVYLTATRDGLNEDKFKVMYFKDFTPTSEQSSSTGLEVTLPLHAAQNSIGGIFQPIW